MISDRPMPGNTPVTRQKKEIYLVLLCYATIYLVWSATYLFIRIAVQTIPPFYVVGLRFFGGGLLFLIIALIGGRIRRLPTIKETAASIFLGVFLLLGGNGLVTLAEKKVDSYLAALVVASTPLGVAFFDRILIGKKISPAGIAGILTGIAGVCLLLYNGDSLSMTFSPEILMLVGGFMSWALATSLGHRIKVFPDTLVNSGLQMLAVGGACLAVLALQHPLTSTMVASFSAASIAGLLYLTIFGSLGFVAYNYLIGHEPAIRVVSYSFVNPMLALFLGLVCAGEKATPYIVPGVIMILGGLFIMLYGDIMLKARIKQPDK